jgi:uncharacterized metal-binding protein YceD (DUF177 family)
MAPPRKFDLEHAKPNPADIGSGGYTLRIEASASERAQLIDECDLESLEALTADMRLETYGKGGFLALGLLKAQLAQICVVTLDPIESEIEERVEQVFLPQAQVDEILNTLAGDELSDPEAEDPPIPFTDGLVDIGALITEIFSLALDPYPRKLGISPGSESTNDEPAQVAPDSPFAVLSKLKKDR